MSDYLFRDIPPEIWTKARVKSVRLGIPLRSILLQLISSWIDGEFPNVDNGLQKLKLCFK